MDLDQEVRVTNDRSDRHIVDALSLQDMMLIVNTGPIGKTSDVLTFLYIDKGIVLSLRESVEEEDILPL